MPLPSTSIGLSWWRRALAVLAVPAAATGLLLLADDSSAANPCDAGTVDKTWQGDVNTSWFTPGNWAPGGVPTAAQDVCIPSGTPNDPAIATGAQANVASIESFAPIELSAGTLQTTSTTQASILHDDLTLSNATLSPAGTLIEEGTLAWTTGTIDGPGTTTIAAGGALQASGDGFQRFLGANAKLRIDGTATWTGSAQTFFNDLAEIEIGSGGVLDARSAALLPNSGAGQLIHVLAGGTLTKSAGGGTTEIHVPVENDGTVSAAAGTLELAGGSASNSGSWAPSGPGVVEFRANNSLGGSSIDGTGTARGPYTVAAGQTLTIHGTYEWGATTIGGPGSTVVASDGQINAPGNGFQRFLGANAKLRITGTATWTGTAQTFFNDLAEIEIGSGGVLDSQSNSAFLPNAGAGQLIHVLAGGRLTKSAGAGVTEVDVPVENDGTVGATAGTLALGGGSDGLASGGKFSSQAGSVEFDGGTHLLDGASVIGAGTTRITSGIVNVEGTVTTAAASTLTLAGGTLGSADASGGTINGTLAWTTGTIDGPGTTTIAAGGALQASGDGFQRFLGANAKLRIDGTATWTGSAQTFFNDLAEIEIGSGGVLDARSAALLPNSGAGQLIHVLAGGTLTKSAGGGTTEIHVPVENDGTVSAAAGTLELAGGSASNSGSWAPSGPGVVEFRANNSLGGSSIDGTGTARGPYTVAAGQTLTIHGTYEWGATTIGGPGSTVVASDGQINAPGNGFQRFLGANAKLRITGTATWTGTAQTFFNDLAEIEIGSGGVLDSQSNSAFLPNAGAGQLIHVLAGGRLTKSAGAGVTEVDVPVENDGTVGATAGTLALGGGSDGLASGGKFSSQAGSVEFDGGTHLLDGASVIGAGTTRITNGAVNATTSASVAAAATLALAGGTLDANAGGAWTINGTLAWTTGTIDGPGTTTIAAGGALRASGDGFQRFLGANAKLRIDGTATWTGSAQTFFNDLAEIEIGSGGVLDARSAALLPNSGAGQLIHVLAGGTLTKSAGGGTTNVNVPVENDGTVDVGAGTLTLGQLTNYSGNVLTDGAYVVRNGSTLQINNANITTDAADITLDGVGSRIWDGSQDALRNLATIDPAGRLALRHGRDFARTGAIANNGLLDLDPSARFTATGAYSQSATGTYRTEVLGTSPPVAGTTYGQLSAATTNLAGTVVADTSAVRPAVLTNAYDIVTGTRTGTFSTETIEEEYALDYRADKVVLQAHRPETVITAGPADGGFTNDTTPTFAFTADRPLGTLRCSVDGGPFLLCTSPMTIGPLADGLHTFAVRGIDRYGNGDQTPASRAFTVDTDPPETTIDSGPATGSFINDETPTFGFSSDEPGTFACSVDGSPFSPCSTQFTTDTLDEGSHTFRVRAIDRATNIDASPAARAFVVDVTPPQTAITSGPAQGSAITDTTPTFQSTVTETGSTRQCSLDGAPFTACTSPTTLGPLADGQHTFRVRGVDRAGNLDPTPAGRTFTVDTVPPDTQITGGPRDGGVAIVASPSFQFSSNETQSTFKCRVDGGAAVNCNSGDSFGPLADGSHTFTVRATDRAGNPDPTPASRTFIVDSNPPSLTIGDVTVGEGDAGTSIASLTVSLSRVPNHGVWVNFATQNGSAVAGGDYHASSGELAFGPTETSKAIHVPIVGDLYKESQESLTVNLSTAEGATIADGSGAITINDPDVCTVVGSAGDDILNGTPGVDYLCGLEGNDRLNGAAGGDVLNGGPGRDIAWYLASPAGVTVNLSTGGPAAGGFAAGDTFIEVENVHGSAHPDGITGTTGANLLSGNEADDEIHGLGGNDDLSGGDQNDQLFGESGDDNLQGGAGLDALNGGPHTPGVGDYCDAGSINPGESKVNCERSTPVP